MPRVNLVGHTMWDNSDGPDAEASHEPLWPMQRICVDPEEAVIKVTTVPADTVRWCLSKSDCPIETVDPV